MATEAISTDVVDTCEIAGVTVTWLRERSSDGGHHVVMRPRDNVTTSNHGPFDRSEARLAYESMRAALLCAAQQQTARLRRIRPSAKRWASS